MDASVSLGNQGALGARWDLESPTAQVAMSLGSINTYRLKAGENWDVKVEPAPAALVVLALVEGEHPSRWWTKRRTCEPRCCTPVRDQR